MLTVFKVRVIGCVTTKKHDQVFPADLPLSARCEANTTSPTRASVTSWMNEADGAPTADAWLHVLVWGSVSIESEVS